MQCFNKKLKKNKNSHGTEQIYLFNMSVKISMATRGSKQGVMEWPRARGAFMIPVRGRWRTEVYLLCVYDMCLCVCFLWGKGIPTLKTKHALHTHHTHTPRTHAHTQHHTHTRTHTHTHTHTHTTHTHTHTHHTHTHTQTLSLIITQNERSRLFSIQLYSVCA